MIKTHRCRRIYNVYLFLKGLKVPKVIKLTAWDFLKNPFRKEFQSMAVGYRLGTVIKT
jgi:hypothetical protein